MINKLRQLNRIALHICSVDGMKRISGFPAVTRELTVSRTRTHRSRYHTRESDKVKHVG
jgi:hypothetical protein